MRKFSCDEARAHLSDALAGEIGRPEANVLEAHLLDCEPCCSLSELFLWQDRVLSELAGQARLETLMARVREGLENLDQVPVDDDARPRWSVTISSKWIAAAAVFVLAVLTVLFWKPSPPDSSTAQIPPAPPRQGPAPAPADNPVELPEKAPVDVPVVPPSDAPQAPTPVVDAPKLTPVPPTPPKAPDPIVDPKPAPKKDAVASGPRNPGKEFVEAPPKPKTLDEAVRGGIAFLRQAATIRGESKADELVLWTYVHGGVPENDPDFQSLLKSILSRKLETTYNVALTAMILEELDRVKYQKRIAQCAQFLVDNQCANGQWHYGAPSIFAEDLTLPPLPPKFKGIRKVDVKRQREGPPMGDNSNTQIALLGLRACFDAGVIVPSSTIDQAARWWRESQSRSSAVKAPAIAPEGWCYGKHDHKPYGSMTVGGIASLVICDYLQGKDVKKDREVANGMEWLAKNFSVTYNPGPYEHARMQENTQHSYYYYLYGLERVGMLYGTEQIGNHYWFARGLPVLIEQQRPDGSWRSPVGNEVHDTCFAILFLRKATRTIDVATPGAGSGLKK